MEKVKTLDLMNSRKLRLSICAVMARHILSGDSLLLAASKAGMSSAKFYDLCKIFVEFDEIKDYAVKLRKKESKIGKAIKK